MYYCKERRDTPTFIRFWLYPEQRVLFGYINSKMSKCD